MHQLIVLELMNYYFVYIIAAVKNKLQFYKLCILIPKNCGLRSNSIGGGSAVE